MITPSQMDPKSPDYFLIDQLEQEIDKSVRMNHGQYSFERGFAPNIYPPHVCYKTALRYHEAGWKYVYYHVVPATNRTGFKLSMEPLNKEQLPTSCLCVSEEYTGILPKEQNTENPKE